MPEANGRAGSPRAGHGEVIGFFHAAVTVGDLDRSLAFYRDALGLELRSRRDVREDYIPRIIGREFTMVRQAFLGVPGSDSGVELLEYVGIERRPQTYEPVDPGSGHFALIVDNIHAVDARLRAAGYRARSTAPIEITGGPYRGSFAIYFIDPDGHPVELIQRVHT
jgi:catechol 2,3-dioxygenase-like lactoylglutathione lyase family enzyme